MTPDHAGDLERTVPMVPLEELLDLNRRYAGFARVVAAMRKAQRAYFDAKKRNRFVSPDPEWQAARAAEKRCDAALPDALNADRRPIPGLEGGAT